MIKLINTAQQPVEANGTIIRNWSVRSDQAVGRPANHNLTREARESNVVVIGGHFASPDFRPDIGVRLSKAA